MTGDCIARTTSFELPVKPAVKTLTVEVGAKEIETYELKDGAKVVLVVPAVQPGEGVTIRYRGAGDAPGPIVTCSQARADFRALAAELEAQPKTCAADADCLLARGEPASSCPDVLITTRAVLDLKMDAYAAAAGAVERACASPMAQCDRANPDKAVCDAEKKICTGEF